MVVGGFFLFMGSDTGTVGRKQGKRSMQFNYRTTGRFMRRQFVRLAWTTTQQKWTTRGALIGLAFALMLPGFGVASAGGGISGWIVDVPLFTLLFGLAGNRFGVGREKATLLRQMQTEQRQD